MNARVVFKQKQKQKQKQIALIVSVSCRDRFSLAIEGFKLKNFSSKNCKISSLILQ
jgi:hypothetical protein